MALDPRTPVLVGVGQVTNRPDPGVDLADRPDPPALLARALRAAADDAGDGSSGPGDRLLRRADSLRILKMVGGRLPNPGLLVAADLGIEPVEQVVTAVGGNTPQSLVNHTARAIARGELDVALLGGGECVYTRTAARKAGRESDLHWRTQGEVPAPVPFGVDRPALTDLESARGLALPIQVYPLLENALRLAHGWSLGEHRQRFGGLWSRFSAVAAGNPHAWLPEFRTPEEILTPGPANRMISFPYPKLCTANIQVDQAAALILCSLASARDAGVPEDRWIFPLAGAEGCDHWFLSERDSLAASPAIAAAGRAALDLAGVGIDDVAAFDLYSCFPSAVQIAAAALGVAIDDPDRPLTVTGGLTFSGGPVNNYSTHAVAAMVERLRGEPGAVGLVSGLGWYTTKHSVGLYSSRPPSEEGRGEFAWRDVQADVDALLRREPEPEATGPVEVEAFTVLYGRDGGRERAILACRTPRGGRTWANVTDPDQLAVLTETEAPGWRGTLRPEGILDLDAPS